MHAKVMVVDDEPDTVGLVKMILEDEGFDVVAAYSGKECLEKLKKEDVNLVLLDVRMPEMDGIEVFHKINERYKDISVIMLTVLKASPKDKEVLFKEGLGDYILKPFDNDDLIRRIHHYLGDVKIS